jgi:GntR family transcriptional repressor for pyruvate dehydrogenase complex
LSTIKKVRLSDSVTDAIGRMITENGFSPGDKFHSEKELTGKLGVSRSSVREAVRILEARGLVNVRHGKGIFIAEGAAHDLGAFSTWLKNNEQPILDLFEVRLLIEPKVAWKAARFAEQTDIDKMELACANFKHFADEDNTSEAMKYDREFHRLLAKTAKNKTLFHLMNTITTSLPDGWISSLHVPGRVQKTVSEHGGVFEAVKAGDSDRAMNAMREHLENAVDDITASLNK